MHLFLLHSLVIVTALLAFAAGEATTTTQVIATLLAPVYRNVTAGESWLYPNNSFDLGARSMSCECFDPSETCCVPQSSAIVPFCSIENTTCCADTYCLAGETCCGQFCCTADTGCNVKLTGSGCCPKGEICNTLATCYDASSTNCTNTISPKAGCCPEGAPFCRDFKPNGIGCYASSTMATSSSLSLDLPATTKGLGLSTAAVQESGTAIVTISVIQNTNGLSLDFATHSVISNAATTSYILDYPLTSSLDTGSKATVTFSPTTAAYSTSPSSMNEASKSKQSAFCHNDDSKNPMPCPPVSGAKTTGSSLSESAPSTDIGYSPPGTSVYKSQANRLKTPISGAISFVKISYKDLSTCWDDLVLAFIEKDASFLSQRHWFLMLSLLFTAFVEISIIGWKVYAIYAIVSNILHSLAAKTRDPKPPPLTLTHTTPTPLIGIAACKTLDQHIARLTALLQTQLVHHTLNRLSPEPTLPQGSDPQPQKNLQPEILLSSLHASIQTLNTAITIALATANPPQPSIHLVPNSGRPLTSASPLGREISPPILATARPFKSRHVGTDETIHLVQGSGRRFSDAVREGTQARLDARMSSSTGIVADAVQSLPVEGRGE